MPILRKLTPHQYEVLAYLVVGGWNTAFGIGLYTLGYLFLGAHIHYVLLAAIVQVMAITNAFVCYKFFVFRAKGNWLIEYLRCYLVYGVGALLGMLLLSVFVESFRMSPVIANVLSTIIVIVLSFLGHKYFSFRKKMKR